uniref:UDP-gluconosyltransferase n=1 Tax=Trialeurodes vaporariorum TaxID=88556 RepID=A0A873P544_TRIVP|nr:UDP-gluconosyltransferase [Trialeurodes vaporariorum]
MRSASFTLGAAWFIFSLFSAFDCHKILFVIPTPFKSHFLTVVPLAEELARREHRVTVVSPFRREKPNYREILIHDEIHESDFNITSAHKRSKILAPFLFWDYMNDAMDAALSTEAFHNLIHSNDTYDVIIAEVTWYQPCLAAFSHKFRAPIIDISSTAPRVYTSLHRGLLQPFSYVPESRLPLSDRMNFYERLYNTVFGLTQLLGEYYYHLPRQEALMRKHFTYPGAETLPPIRELIENLSIFFINSHFSINYPQPHSPNVIEIGGFHLKSAKNLPPDFQKIMDESKQGVIYISFGSLIKPKMFSSERIHAIVAAVKRVKQLVIMRWDDPAPFKGLTNVLVVSWAPQQDILAHPNLCLFVTHGGHNSLIEATHAGVPVIGIPVFADHFHSIRFYEEKGIGKGLDLEEFTSDDLFDSIDTIVNTPSFRENAREISRRTKDRLGTAMERAIYWTEYVIRHKGAHHLKPYSVFLPFYQYLLLDVLGFSLLVSLAIYKLIKLLVFKSLCSDSRSKVECTEYRAGK